MQVLDRTGVGTLWSICKTKFALKDHSHNYLPLSGGTLTGDLLFSNSGTTFRQIRGTCGDNDFWRIGGGATGNNAGYMEIATADDGTEPIYVRQYSGTFSTITRTATLLDGSGNTSFPGTVAAAKFKGALEGNASTASNASTVNGHTVNANVPSNAKFTDTNTWRPIQDNLTSTSTSESLSANLGRVLKGYIDSKLSSTRGAIAMIDWKDPLINGDAFSTKRASIELYYGNNYLNFKKFYASSIKVTYKFEERNTLPGASFIFYKSGDWNRPQDDKDVLIQLMGYNADKYCTLAYVENLWCEDYVTYYIIGVKLKENCIFRCINNGGIISYVTLKNDTPYVCDSQGNILT